MCATASSSFSVFISFYFSGRFEIYFSYFRATNAKESIWRSEEKLGHFRRSSCFLPSLLVFQGLKTSFSLSSIKYLHPESPRPGSFLSVCNKITLLNHSQILFCDTMKDLFFPECRSLTIKSCQGVRKSWLDLF